MSDIATRLTAGLVRRRLLRPGMQMVWPTGYRQRVEQDDCDTEWILSGEVLDLTDWGTAGALLGLLGAIDPPVTVSLNYDGTVWEVDTMSVLSTPEFHLAEACARALLALWEAP